MLKKKSLSILLVLITIILLISSTCNAATSEVTKENLTEAFQNFVSSGENNNNFKIEVGEDTINLTSDDGAYEMKYNLTNGTTFSIEMDIQDGMTYDDFEKEEGKLVIPMLGYIAVANINGVDFEDSAGYFLMSYLKNVISNSELQSGEYIIYDDRNVEPGTNVDVDSEGKTVIKASEFGDHAMEYINSIYGKPQTVDDSDIFNTYKYSIEQQDVTSTSCKIVATLSINENADFSKLVGYADSQGNPSGDNNNEEQNQQNGQNQQNQPNQPNQPNQTQTSSDNQKKDNTTTKTPLPKAGADIAIYIALAIVAVLIIIFGIKYIRLKDVK